MSIQNLCKHPMTLISRGPVADSGSYGSPTYAETARTTVYGYKFLVQPTAKLVEQDTVTVTDGVYLLPDVNPAPSEFDQLVIDNQTYDIIGVKPAYNPRLDTLHHYTLEIVGSKG